jgi:hypothetical protein
MSVLTERGAMRRGGLDWFTTAPSVVLSILLIAGHTRLTLTLLSSQPYLTLRKRACCRPTMYLRKLVFVAGVFFALPAIALAQPMTDCCAGRDKSSRPSAGR